MGYLSNEQANFLNKLISKYELYDFRDQILSIAKTSIQLTPTEPYHDQGVGITRLGGLPDFPMDMEWPKIDDSYPVFLAQINLSEIQFAVTEKAPLADTQLPLFEQNAIKNIPHEHELLPKSGMFYFFLGNTKNYHDIEHRVIYVPQSKLNELRPAQAPDKKAMIKTNRGDLFIPYLVNLQTAISLPMFFYWDFDSELKEHLSEYQYDNFMRRCEELCGAVGFDRAASRLMGFPYSPDIDWQLRNHLKQENRVSKITTSEVNISNQQWLLLFELHSHDETEMYWGDWGKLAFIFHKDHLTRMDFNHAFLAGFSH